MCACVEIGLHHLSTDKCKHNENYLSVLLSFDE